MNRNNRNNDRFDSDPRNNRNTGSWASGSNYGGSSDYDRDYNSYRNQSHAPGSHIWEEDNWDRHASERDYNFNPSQGPDQGRRDFGRSEYDRDYRRGNYSTNSYGRNSDFGGRNDFNRNFQGSERNEYRNTADHFAFGSREDRMMNQRPYGGGRYQSADRYGENFGQGGMNSGNRWMSNERSGFWGKGPKGYRRSDDRIKEDVCEALYHDNQVDASEIEVSVKEGTVTLSGTVSDRESKRAAERCIENLSGVDDVRNDIRVSRETGNLSGSSESQKNDKGQIRKLS